MSSIFVQPDDDEDDPMDPSDSQQASSSTMSADNLISPSHCDELGENGVEDMVNLV